MTARVLATLCGIAFGSLTTSLIIRCVSSDYQFERHYGQYWALADKTSTIQAKADYIAQFVKALDEGIAKGDFATHDAVWLTTPNNELARNVDALRTLMQRLEQIQKMDPASFQYNTAIQQITEQEQGQAGAMLGVIRGCYDLQNYTMVWGWIFAVAITIDVAIIIVVIGACCVIIS